MDDIAFDALTRSAVTDISTRRTLVRLLVGTALGAVTSRLGLTEDTEAKAKPHSGKSKRKHQQPTHTSQERQARQHPTSSGGVQSEGKGKGKGKGKGHKPPPLPPGCKNCNACQECKNGTCVPDTSQERVRCEGSGAACGYCQSGACAPSDERPCADGVCPKKGQCCPEEGAKQCPDPGSQRGFYCVDKNACCPETERTCASGRCLPRAACCPEQKRCGPTLCVGQNECCPGEKSCGDETCVSTDACCPNDPEPACDPCHEAVCAGGGWVCRAKCQPDEACCQGVCFSPCRNGCESDGACGGCTKTPAGKTYCPAQQQCVSNQCPSGQFFDPASCRCEAGCADGSVICPLALEWQTGMPNGCCRADRVFPDTWYGTGNQYCRSLNGPEAYWCTTDGLPGT
jgi:hypothetical protein